MTEATNPIVIARIYIYILLFCIYAYLIVVVCTVLIDSANTNLTVIEPKTRLLHDRNYYKPPYIRSMQCNEAQLVI